MNSIKLLALSVVFLLPGALRADDATDTPGPASVTVPASNGAVPQFRPPPASLTPVPVVPSSSAAASTKTKTAAHARPVPHSPYTPQQQEQRVLTESIRAYNAQQWANFKTLWASQGNTILSDSALSPTQRHDAMVQLKQQERAASAVLNQQLRANAEQKWATLRQQWAQSNPPNKTQTTPK